MQRLYTSRARRGRKRATITRADTEAVHIMGCKREEKGDNKKAELEVMGLRTPTN